MNQKVPVRTVMICLCFLVPSISKIRCIYVMPGFSVSSHRLKSDGWNLVKCLFPTTISHIRYQNLGMPDKCSVCAFAPLIHNIKTNKPCSGFSSRPSNWWVTLCQMFYLHHRSNLNAVIDDIKGVPIQIRTTLYHVPASILKLYLDLLSNIQNIPAIKTSCRVGLFFSPRSLKRRLEKWHALTSWASFLGPEIQNASRTSQWTVSSPSLKSFSSSPMSTLGCNASNGRREDGWSSVLLLFPKA